jgi:hypothetical protein
MHLKKKKTSILIIEITTAQKEPHLHPLTRINHGFFLSSPFSTPAAVSKYFSTTWSLVLKLCISMDTVATGVIVSVVYTVL